MVPLKASREERGRERHGEVWRAVDVLIGRAPGLRALRAHGLLLLAAERGHLAHDELEAVRGDLELAAIRTMIVPDLLRRLREVTDGPLLVLKGPEVAARYPDPALRSFVDLDVLVADAEGVQRALVGAGFEEDPDPPWAFRRSDGGDLFRDRQHCHPLRWSGWPLRIEVHRRPSWPSGLRPPSFEELVSRAGPSATRVEGVLAPAPADHALILAAHAWARAPLARVRDLLDVRLEVAETNDELVGRRAREWGMQRLWTATHRAQVSLLGPGPSRDLPLWAGNITGCREQTVFEAHISRWLSPFWALPPHRALPAALRDVVSDLSPAAHEPWRAKLRRAGSAIRHANVEKSSHDREIGRESRQLRR